MSTLYIYLQHATRLVRNTGGKLGPRRFTVLSLLCSDVRISRNQLSSLSVLNKYIFTRLSTAPSRSENASLKTD